MLQVNKLLNLAHRRAARHGRGVILQPTGCRTTLMRGAHAALDAEGRRRRRALTQQQPCAFPQQRAAPSGRRATADTADAGRRSRTVGPGARAHHAAAAAASHRKGHKHRGATIFVRQK